MSKDSNGFSDPYVVFTGPILGEEKRTVIIEKVRIYLRALAHQHRPWILSTTMKMSLSCGLASPTRYLASSVGLTFLTLLVLQAYLTTQHLFLIVRDYDHTSKDDEMGQCVISLKHACGSRPVAFKVPVFLSGVNWGTLEGKVHVVWGEGRKKGRRTLLFDPCKDGRSKATFSRGSYLPVGSHQAPR